MNYIMYTLWFYYYNNKFTGFYNHVYKKNKKMIKHNKYTVCHYVCVFKVSEIYFLRMFCL